MIIVESLLKGKHNLIQVTLDEVIVFFTNDSNNQNKVVLDFIEACKIIQFLPFSLVLRKNLAWIFNFLNI